MKNKKLLFNHLVLQYHKSIGRLKRLSERGLNFRRQTILNKRIEKIKQKLLSIKYALTKAAAVASFVSGVAVLQPYEANAQNFQPPVINPFSLNLASDSISNIQSADFADLDADGDFDAIAYTRVFDKFILIENTGTQEIPEFGAIEELSISIPEPDYDEYINLQFLDNICLGDLDFDGDFDLMGGGNNGDFIYFENIGTDSLPEYIDGVTNPFLLLNTGINQSSYFIWFEGENYLEFVDIDGDGDLDIYTRSKFYAYDPPLGYNDDPNSYNFYKFFFIENIGNPETPIFQEHILTNEFSQIGDFADLDLDGDFDFMSSSFLSTRCEYYNYTYNYFSGIFVSYKENIGTNISPQFQSSYGNPFGLGTIIEIPLISPSIADFDNDNDMDLMFVKSTTGFYYYENKLCDTIFSSAVLVDEHISLMAEQIDAQYQWFQCNYSFDEIEGATDQSLNIPSSGNYMVQINTGDCTVYSDCFEFVNCTELINLIVTLNDEVFTGYSQSADSYQWLNCNNSYMPIEAETNPNFYPTSSGAYSLEVTSGTCKDTSACYEYDICASFSNEVQYIGSAFIASQYNAAYQWIDCDNGNLPIEGETNQIFSPPVSGNYALNVSNTNCNLTSDCFEYDVCGYVLTGVSTDNNSITALQDNASYQWYNCDLGIVYENEQNQNFEPINAGNYSCEIEIGNCYIETDCIYFELCDNISTEIAINGNTLVAPQSDAIYQWIICTIPITFVIGENDQTFSPLSPGSYAVLIEYNNCYIATECFDFTITEINDHSSSTQFSLIPNPTEGKLKVTADKPLQNAFVQIKSVTGQIIFQQKNISGANLVFDLSYHANGLYFLEVTEKGITTRLKIIKE